MPFAQLSIVRASHGPTSRACRCLLPAIPDRRPSYLWRSHSARPSAQGLTERREPPVTGRSGSPRVLHAPHQAGSNDRGDELEASCRLGVTRGTVPAGWCGCRTAACSPGTDPTFSRDALYESSLHNPGVPRGGGPGQWPTASRGPRGPHHHRAGDMLCRVMIRSNTDLQRVLDAIVSAEGAVRSATLISLTTQVPYRVLHLVRATSTSSRPSGSPETPPAIKARPRLRRLV